MTEKILYIAEQKNLMPENAFCLTEKSFLETENIKKHYVYFWLGNMDTLISTVSTLGIEKALKLLDVLLDGVVAEIENDKWIYYTCNAVKMYCCAGAYIRIVNKKIRANI